METKTKRPHDSPNTSASDAELLGDLAMLGFTAEEIRRAVRSARAAELHRELSARLNRRVDAGEALSEAEIIRYQRAGLID